MRRRQCLKDHKFLIKINSSFSKTYKFLNNNTRNYDHGLHHKIVRLITSINFIFARGTRIHNITFFFIDLNAPRPELNYYIIYVSPHFIDVPKYSV